MSDDLEQQIVVGDDAENFVLTNLGKAMLEIADKDADAAALEFAECDLTNQDKVAKIQQDLRTAMRFPSYLAELVQRGREALTAYQQQEEAKKGSQ